jgi:hypothetical protein
MTPNLNSVNVLANQLRIEHDRASRDGITHQQMSSPIDTALHGYLAGINHAIHLLEQTKTW